MAGMPSPPRSDPPPPATSTTTTTTNTSTATNTTNTTNTTTTTTTSSVTQVVRPAVLDSLAWMNKNENEPEVPTELDSLADQVEANRLEPDPNDLCEKLICGMSHKGMSNEASPKMAIMTPCGEKGHSPVLLEPGMPGKGYFLIPGAKLSSGRWELIKSDPGLALRSEKGCGYAKCDSNWWNSVEAYAEMYPKEVRCEQRETLHSVQWADPDSDGCREHPDSPVWAHPNNTVRMCLKFLEKAVMAKWRKNPEIFNVVSHVNTGKSSSFIQDQKNWILLTFRQLMVWGRSRDFAIDLQLVEVIGMPPDLIAFARALLGKHVGSLPGPEVGAPRSRLLVLKVDKLKEHNSINLLQGKRQHEKISSGSRDLVKATKRARTWEPTVVMGPIPESPRDDPRRHFHYLSKAGEETLREVTMVAPDGSGNTVKAMCTSSYNWEYKCLSCPNQHSVFNTDTVTVLVGDEHSPETMPPMPNGSCACIIRLSKVTVEILNYYIFGTLNDFKGNYDKIGRFGVSELLLKLWKMGKRVLLGITSGTEFMEGGPVSYTESAQVCFSQFMGREQPIEGMVKLLTFPAPLLLRSKHQTRDTAMEPLTSAMADIKVEATHSAMEANTHDITWRMSGMLVQRDQTYSVYREVYTPSPVQETLREVVDYHIKRRIDHNHNSRHAKLSIKETMAKKRGIRACESRMLADKTPNPGYLTEWSVAFHANLLRGGILELSKDDKAYLQKLRRVTIKYYAHLYNVLSNGESFTRAIHSYFLYLGDIQKGEFLCVNLLRHDKVQQFDSAELMRAHWSTCHGIDEGEILLPMVIPVLLKESAKAPTTGHGVVGGPGNPGPGGPPGGSAGPGDDARPAGGSGLENKPRGRGRGRDTVIGKGAGNLERVGPPEGATGSGDDAGKMSEKGTGMSEAGGNPEGPKTVKVDLKPKGKSSHKVTVSKDGEKKMSLRLGSGNPVSGVSRKQWKDRSGKNAIKKRPTKGKSVVSRVNDHSKSTGSLGNPEQVGPPEGATGSGDDARLSTEVNPVEGMAESMEDVSNPAEGLVDPMDIEIEEEVSTIFRNMPYNWQKK